MRDVWLENGVVWAAATTGLPISASRRLTQRAVAMAGETTSRRIVLDFRGATLTGNTLALNWHADMLARLRPPDVARMAMLCSRLSDGTRVWERTLQERGHRAAAFTDSAAALGWLEASDARGTECVDAESLKLLLQRYAEGLGSVPHDQVVAEFTELLDCLLANAQLLGVDAMRGLEQQLRNQKKRRDQRS